MSQPPVGTEPALGKLAPGPGHIGLRRQEIRDPAAGQARIEVIGAGICGTDLHIADDEFPSSPPVTMGHEVTGVVRDVGSGVDESLVGARVAVETYYSYCGRCRHCRGGSPNLCRERRSIGSAVDGGFTRWLLVPARNLHVLPGHVGPHAGALAEPLACVARCMLDPPAVAPGDRVLVAGPGTMGLLAAQVARASGGVVTIVGLESDAERFAVAESMGFDTTLADEAMDGGEPDVVCECSGAEAAARLLLEKVRRGGVFVQVGIYGRPITIDFDTILYKELDVRSGNASTPGSWTRAMALLDQGLVDLEPLVGEVVALSEWERAFEMTRAGDGLKVILDPREGS